MVLNIKTMRYNFRFNENRKMNEKNQILQTDD